MRDNKIKIHPPLYMIGRKIGCLRCSTMMPVIAFLAPKIDDTEEQVGVLTGIDTIPKEVLKFIQSKVSTFKLKHSKMAGKNYFANTCPKCGVIYGDFFLQDEPGSPFFPEDEDAAKYLYIKEIPLTEPIEVSAGLGFGLGEMILSNAKRV
ncbi:MAG: hypothetical protein U9R17_19770 [Thermodesulfobacteriota bacterium]|nr:hypothetical protein [Thermodesulfobacteriota bacterium]